MTPKNSLYFAIIICFAFIGELILLGYIAKMSLAAETETKTSAVLGPSRQSLNLVSLVPVTTNGGTATVAVYDDPTTPRKEDYLELYDGSGELVAVGWFDEFGIQRLAIDRAVVEGRDKLQGVFVMLVEGHGI
jgi:hypothetical protein